MEKYFVKYLFTRHILVAEGTAGTEDDARFETLFSLANLFGIRVKEGEKLVQPDMIRTAEECLGKKVPEPFYKGFPESVRKLSPDQLLFDQMVHYTITYGLGDFSAPGHSLFELNFERTAFREDTEPRDFAVLSEGEAALRLGEMVNDLLAGTRPLNDVQYELVSEYILKYTPEIRRIASRNTCVRLLMDTRNLDYAVFLSLSDVIRLVEEMNMRLYGSTDIRKLNLKNQDRKFIAAVMDRLFETGRCDLTNCYEKKKSWNGLLHHIHYTARTDEAKLFLSAMRGRENHSVYAEFEARMREMRIFSAVEALRKGKGAAAVLRNMDYLISRCETPEEIFFVMDQIDTKNVIVLLQLLIRYGLYKEDKTRSFVFTKYNRLIVHKETPEEKARRKSQIPPKLSAMLSRRIRENLEKVLKDRLGRVYISPEMKNYALPIQENTAQGGFDVLTRGSRIHIPAAKKIRGFTYWEKVDDIDLSVFGIDTRGNRMEFSWRTMAGRQSGAITYSGDETSGYSGGSEYYDIDLPLLREQYPDMRYLIFCNNVFSGLPFSAAVCRAGYMLRDQKDSGEVYEPKTVKTAFTINAESTFAYLFGVDVNTNDLIWLNMARNSCAAVAGNTEMDFLLDYFHVTDIINMYDLFKMMAKELVDDPAKADVIVTNRAEDVPAAAEAARDITRAAGIAGAAKMVADEVAFRGSSAGGNMTTPKKVMVIREYDIEKIMALMN